jgi:hypothetical protein
MLLHSLLRRRHSPKREVDSFLSVAVLSSCVFITLNTTMHAEETAIEEPIRVFVGTVVDEAGAPIADALVEWGHFQAPQAEREFTFTDANGEYRLETTRAWQDFRLGVHKAGYSPRWVDGLIPTPEPSVVDFTLPVGKDMTGVVVDPGGVPLPGVAVYAKTGEYPGQRGRGGHVPVRPSPYPGPARVATTNERGEFVLRDLTEVVSIIQDGDREITEVKTDRVDLTFRRDGRRLGWQVPSITMPVVLAASSISRPVTQATTGVVRATVIDANTLEPIPQFRARWWYSDTSEQFSSPNGEFTLTEPFLKGQEYEVEVLSENYAPGAAKIVAIDADEKPQVTIALTPHASMECEVVDALSGLPLPGVEIVSGIYVQDFRDVPWSQIRKGQRHWLLSEQQRLVTDSQGRGMLVEGETPQILFIIHPGYARTVIEPEMRQPLLTEDKVLRIALTPESRIRGRVHMDPVPGAQFDMIINEIGRGGPKEIYYNFYTEGQVNENGEFEVDCLGEGSYELKMRFRLSDSYREIWTTEVKVDNGEIAQVEFGAPAGPYTLRGQAPPFTIVSLSQFEAVDRLVFAGYADAEGNFEISGLPEGFFNVQIDANFAAAGLMWRRVDFVEIAGDTVRDFTNSQLLEE